MGDEAVDHEMSLKSVNTSTSIFSRWYYPDLLLLMCTGNPPIDVIGFVDVRDGILVVVPYIHFVFSSQLMMAMIWA